MSPACARLCQRAQTAAQLCAWLRRWAFSIWGAIFLLEGVGTVYQLLPHGYGPDGWKQRFVNSVRGYVVWLVGLEDGA